MSRSWIKLKHVTKKILGVSLLIVGFMLPIKAQGTFQSGSTGADGAFNPTASQSIAVPESGVFNFTSVTIPSGVTVTFTANSKNSPVTILATSDVTISGTIDVSGKAGGGGIFSGNGSGSDGGPGGFAGGNGGYGVTDLFTAMNGSGPGGGQGGSGFATTSSVGAGGSYASVGEFNTPATTYGSGLIQPLIGGSGGGGGGATNNSLGAGGGGGGGAILIASSTTITLSSTGFINAKGGDGGGFGPGNGSSPAGGGSGGAIRLVANTLTGTGRLSVEGGAPGRQNQTVVRAGAGAGGYIRAEAISLSNFTPITSSAIASLGSPNQVVIANSPQLRISSVAGITAPTVINGTLRGVADIVVPSSQTNPVPVVLQGVNIAASTTVTIKATPAFGVSTEPVTTLFTATGTPGVTSATASINLPIGMSAISAIASIDLTQAKLEPIFMDGEKVDRIEITAVYGEQSQTTYITSSGKKIIK